MHFPSPRALALLATLALPLLQAPAARADSLTKSPDLGAYWADLSTFGTYIYANSFVPTTDSTIDSIGIWLVNNGGDTSAQPVLFEIFASAAGGGPDSATVLASTGVLSLDVTGGLALYSASTTSSDLLLAGQTYWVAASEVGLSGGGNLRFGAHTQNSGGITDNGTFAYSNDSTGVTFDTTTQTPEMAFSLTLTPTIPEPASLALLATGLLGLGLALGRRAA